MLATRERTNQYFIERNRLGFARLLGKSPLLVSRMAFHAERIHEYEPQHRESLIAALRTGINFIITSGAKTENSALRLLRDVINELKGSGPSRDQIVLALKVDVAAKKSAHEQIQEALQLMQIDGFDVVILFNSQPLPKTAKQKEEHWRLVETALKEITLLTQSHQVGYVGFSSEGLTCGLGQQEHLSAEKMMTLAEALLPKNRFVLLQFPINLYETNALFLPNQSDKTLLEFCHDQKLFALSERPLHSRFKGRMVQLSSFTAHPEAEIKVEFHKAMTALINLERTLVQNHPSLQWATKIRDRLNELDDLLLWRQLLSDQIIPALNKSLPRLEVSQPETAQIYRTEIARFFELLTQSFESAAAVKSTVLSDQIDIALGGKTDCKTLSERVLRIYLSLAQLDGVAISARLPNQIAEALSVSSTFEPDKAKALLKSFSQR